MRAAADPAGPAPMTSTSQQLDVDDTAHYHPRMTARRRAPKRKSSSTATGRPSRASRSSHPPLDPRQPGSGLAPGMHAINTYLAVENVAASMEFLEQALGF